MKARSRHLARDRAFLVPAACVSFEAYGDNDIQFHVSREGLSGEYDIYLNIDNLRYDTKYSIKL
ncbi:MAG TPA: hypothetical protein GXX34_05140 [Clostridia bacterium]|nr:hypothetical protein [Clostridia bacterium]